MDEIDAFYWSPTLLLLFWRSGSEKKRYDSSRKRPWRFDMLSAKWTVKKGNTLL